MGRSRSEGGADRVVVVLLVETFCRTVGVRNERERNKGLVLVGKAVNICEVRDAFSSIVDDGWSTNASKIYSSSSILLLQLLFYFCPPQNDTAHIYKCEFVKFITLVIK